jgi:4-diphosphocytidyl-2-C-methyl-D-erythritol kinase
MALYDIAAPAKLNLFLHVVGRRPDGYHLLETVFRFVALYDWLDIDIRADGRIVREGSAAAGVASDDDLVVRAARLLQHVTGTRQGAQIAYRKNIPQGGGLGGGSSDAASTLIALNRLWNTGLSRAELMRLGLQLGADVPVFIFGQAAFAQGIGEQLAAIDLPERHYVVVQPQQAVPTAGIFSAADLTRDTKPVKMSVFADWQKQNAPENGYVARGYFGENNLQPVVVARYPVVGQALGLLGSLGVTARMTGSGACLFTEFVTEQQAGFFHQQIRSKMQGCENNFAAVVKSAWVCKGLQEHPLKNWLHD